MTALVIGCTGLIGSAVCRRLERDALWFRGVSRPELDLSRPGGWTDFAYSQVFIAAGVNGIAECEGNRAAWRVNADGPVAIGGAFLRRGVFVVYVSSGAVEWAGHTAYGRARQHAELGLTAIGAERLAIVRPEKVTPQTADDLARLMVGLAYEGRHGIHRWPNSD